MNLTLKSLPLFIYFFSSLEKIEIRGAIMQHILSEGLRGGGLLSHTLLITRTCDVVVQGRLPRFLGIAHLGGSEAPSACSLCTCRHISAAGTLVRSHRG